MKSLSRKERLKGVRKWEIFPITTEEVQVAENQIILERFGKKTAKGDQEDFDRQLENFEIEETKNGVSYKTKSKRRYNRKWL